MSRRSVLARQWAMMAVAAVSYIALAIYATSSDTGPAGWINAAQARSDGTYSTKITLMVLSFAGVIVALPLWLLLWPKDVPPLESGAPPRTTGSRLVAAFVGFVVVDAIVWGAAIGWATWQAHGKNIDATATYAPLTLTAATPSHATEGDHLALRGRLLGDHVVTRTDGGYGSKKMALVPIVEADWKEGDPVHLLLSVASDMSYVVGKALQSNQGVLLVRVEGMAPAPALDIFTRMKAPIADDARTLAFIPSEGGHPSEPPAGPDWTNVQILGWIGTACVLIVCFFYTIMPWMLRRAERQRVAREARAAARR